MAEAVDSRQKQLKDARKLSDAIVDYINKDHGVPNRLDTDKLREIYAELQQEQENLNNEIAEILT